MLISFKALPEMIQLTAEPIMMIFMVVLAQIHLMVITEMMNFSSQEPKPLVILLMVEQELIVLN